VISQYLTLTKAGPLTAIPHPKPFYQLAGMIHRKAHVCGGWETANTAPTNLYRTDLFNRWVPQKGLGVYETALSPSSTFVMPTSI
jgi:hypothetical protein